MSQPGYPPGPPVPPASPDSSPPAYPYGYPPAPGTVPGAPQAYPPQAPSGRPPKRSRAWLWWTLGILGMVALIVGGCAAMVWMLGSDTGMPATGFGESVAVINIDGVIAGTGDVYSGVVTPTYFRGLLDQAEEDDMVKAIVLHVNSPGGTAAASEEIADYVKRSKKPVFVSIGDVGASGAYMVSSQADEIWAMPASAVGSIGVITEIPNVEGLLDTLGIEFQVITAGKYKDAGSPYRPLTEEEQALIQGQVDAVYDQFIDIVAEGRDLPRSKVETLATGWAYDGAEAKRLGLVDKLGTYQQTLDAAAKAGGIEGDYEVINYTEELPDLLGALIGISDRLGALDALTRDAAVKRSLPR